MEKYRRVFQKQKEPEDKNEMRITARNKPRFTYLAYAHHHFEEGNKKLIIKAMGSAISRAIEAAELIKRKFKGLHQENEITVTQIEDVYEPIEEGLDKVTRSRQLTMLIITLSYEPKDTSHYGYQPPLPASQIQPYEVYQKRGAASGRGGYSGGHYYEEGYEPYRGPRGYRRGNYRGYQGRGGRGGRGQYRGGRGEYRGGRGEYRGGRGEYRGGRGYDRGGYERGYGRGYRGRGAYQGRQKREYDYYEGEQFYEDYDKHYYQGGYGGSRVNQGKGGQYRGQTHYAAKPKDTSKNP